ncbi:MAG: GNAT family N-acetyltransferase, partial [Janthinobacterium lividum]
YKTEHVPLNLCYIRNSFTQNIKDKSLRQSAIYIGEKEYLGKGIGTEALSLFLRFYEDFDRSYIFVDPDLKNIAAIKTYQKVGFEMIQQNIDDKNQWMLLDLVKLKK